MVQNIRTKLIVVILSLLFTMTALVPTITAQFSGDLNAPTWQQQPLNGPLTPLIASTDTHPQGGGPRPMTAYPLVVHLPTSQVSVILHLNNPNSYLNTTLSSVPGGYDVTSGSYYGWCGDYYHYIQLNTAYQCTLYSTYDNSLPTYLYHQNWTKINYILNHKVGTDYQQVQDAIWYLLDCGNRGLNSNGWTMVNQAIANGAGYIPAVGNKCAVLVGVSTTVQRTILELTIPARTLTTNCDGQGTIAKTPDQTSYVYGQTVNLSATPTIGWTFDHWSGDATGSTTPVTVTMNGNKAVTATFTQNQYLLTMSVSPSTAGTVTPSPAQPGNLYHYSDIVQLTASANPGFTFNSWTGDVTGTTNPTTITITSAKSATALFTQNQYTISTDVDGQGSITKDPQQTTYTYGQTVQLTATADPGWTFDHWTGDASGSSTTATITINDNKAATAHFTQDQYTLSVTTDGSGQVFLNPDQTTYVYDDTIQLTAQADPGWIFNQWTGDITDTANPVTVTMHNSMQVMASFTQLHYTLGIAIDGQGTVTQDPDQSDYTYGQIVHLTATPTIGWTFDHWSGDATGNANEVDITILGNQAVTATFTQNHYTLSTTTDGSGSILKNPDQTTYIYGDNVQLTAQATIGWTFDHWTGDATGTSNPVTITIDGNKAVTAVFTQNQYSLSVYTDGTGTVSKSPDQTTYTYGQVITLTANAGQGWTFNYWSGDATGSTNPTTVTIDGDKTVTAHFSQNQYTLSTSVDGQGSITRDPDQNTYTYGQIVTLTAVPSPGWSFDHWTGDATGSSNPTTVTMNGDKAVTAVFTQNQYTVTITYDGQGTVAKDPDQTTYTYGQTVQLTATPAIGWTFDHWSGDASGSSNPVTITIDGNKAVTAHFTQDQYTLTIDLDGSGTVQKSPDQTTYTYGQVVTLTAQPDQNWVFHHWSGDVTGTTNPTTITITSNAEVTAHFTAQDLTPPTVKIAQPGNFVYLFGKPLCPFVMPLFFHNITVIVNASDAKGGVDHVEIFVDNVSQAVLTTPPYKWMWTETKPMKHTLTAVAYDLAGNHASDTVMVWRWRVHPVLIGFFILKAIFSNGHNGTPGQQN